MLSLPIHEYSMFLHLFQFSLVSFVVFCNFQQISPRFTHNFFSLFVLSHCKWYFIPNFGVHIFIASILHTEIQVISVCLSYILKPYYTQ